MSRPRTGYRRTEAAIDAGLRAYMLRVYNYMAAGLALTGVVRLADFQAAVGDPSIAGGQISGLTLVRPGALQRPADDRAAARPLGAGVLPELPHQPAELSTALALFWVYAALIGVSLASIFVVYTGASITRVFFITAATFGAHEPVGLHHEARPDRPWARSCSWA